MGEGRAGAPRRGGRARDRQDARRRRRRPVAARARGEGVHHQGNRGGAARGPRSEEHTSELQSRLHLVCRLLLEKKKKNNSHYSTRGMSLNELETPLTQNALHICGIISLLLVEAKAYLPP